MKGDCRLKLKLFHVCIVENCCVKKVDYGNRCFLESK